MGMVELALQLGGRIIYQDRDPEAGRSTLDARINPCQDPKASPSAGEK